MRASIISTSAARVAPVLASTSDKAEATSSYDHDAHHFFMHLTRSERAADSMASMCAATSAGSAALAGELRQAPGRLARSPSWDAGSGEPEAAPNRLPCSARTSPAEFANAMPCAPYATVTGLPAIASETW